MMLKILLKLILLISVLFSQGFKMKAYQISTTNKIINSDSLSLNGSVAATFNQKSTSDSLILTGGFARSIQEIYEEPPVIVVENDYEGNIITRANPVVYTAIATDINGISASSLYIQPGGKKTPYVYPMIAVNDTVFAAEVPDSLLSVRNFRAWVVSKDSLDNESISPYEKPAMDFPIGELTMANRFSHYKDGVISKKWRLISWPGILDDETLQKSSLESGHVFYDWDIETNQWSKPNSIIPGKAYWFKHNYNENASFSNHDTPGKAIALEDFEIILKKGWNIIGSPFSFPVNIEYDDEFVSDVYLYGNDTKEGWLEPTKIMNPWAGYAVYAENNNDIITLKPFGEVSESYSARSNISDTWILNLKLDGDQYFDYSGYVGRKLEASDNKGKYDKPLLPSLDNYVSIVLDNNQDYNFKYSSDIRSDQDFNGVWNIRVKSKGNKDDLELSSLIKKNIPSELKVSLVDIQTRIIHNQFLNMGVTITESNQYGYDLKLVAGDAQFVRETSEKILADIPSEFSLGQNYPNPFNPITKMNFELPRSGRVVLTIYNLVGQEVKTLINENLNYGYHIASWDGLDNKGRMVSSGVYFSELQASGIRKTRKMILLK